MKKLFLSILAAGSIATANAQIGSWLVYGNIGYTSTTDDLKTKDNKFDFNPGVGYQFNKDWTAGIALMFSSEANTPDAGHTHKLSQMRVGGFARYTKPLNNIFSLYGQFDLAYQTAKDDDGDGTVIKYNGIYAGVYPAVSIDIPTWFKMNFSFGGLNYQTLKSDAANANTASQLNFTFGQQVNIGISKNFGGGTMHHGHHEPGDDTRHMDTSDDDDDAPKAHHKEKKEKHKNKKKEKHSDED